MNGRKGGLTLYDADIYGLISACCGFCAFSVTEEEEEEDGANRKGRRSFTFPEDL